VTKATLSFIYRVVGLQLSCILWSNNCLTFLLLCFFDLFSKNLTVYLSNQVVIVDMVVACILGFLPFSLGRIILWWSSYFDLSNVEGVEFYTSTISTLLVGYGFIFNVGVCFAGLHTLHHYLRGERLVIALFIRRLSGMFFRGIVYLITVANIGFNILNLMILRPLFFGWLLDICTSKMFGATMSQRFNLLTASSLSSTALHWLLGHIFLNLRPRLSRFLHKVFIILYLLSHHVHSLRSM
jgi:E3 ubiquitin-protein ligase MARCH6